MSGFTARSTVWTKSQDRAPLPRGMVKPERLTAKFIRDEKTKAQKGYVKFSQAYNWTAARVKS